MRRLLIILLLVISAKLSAQINLLIEGVDSTTTTHNGYEIARASQTNLIFRYNKISTASNQAGANMLANGTFDSGDYWFTSNAWSIGSGVATCTANVSASALFQIGPDMITDLEPSTAYTISFDIVSSSPGIWFRILNGSGEVIFIEADYYTTGHYDLNFTTASDLTIGGIRFFTYTDEANPGTIDNIVLIEQ